MELPRLVEIIKKKRVSCHSLGQESPSPAVEDSVPDFLMAQTFETDFISLCTRFPDGSNVDGSSNFTRTQHCVWHLQPFVLRIDCCLHLSEGFVKLLVHRWILCAEINKFLRIVLVCFVVRHLRQGGRLRGG